MCGVRCAVCDGRWAMGDVQLVIISGIVICKADVARCNAQRTKCEDSKLWEARCSAIFV